MVSCRPDTNLLSSVLVQRQLSTLRRRDAPQARAVFAALFRPLLYCPAQGKLLLNQAVNDAPTQRRIHELSGLLYGVDLRVVRWHSWYLLYLYNGCQVCTLSLLSYPSQRAEDVIA